MLPRLSPDGTRVVFSTDWEGPPNLYIADADGSDPRVLVPFDRTQQHAGGWTPDSRQVVYTKRNETFGIDIWAVDVSTGAANHPRHHFRKMACRVAQWPLAGLRVERVGAPGSVRARISERLVADPHVGGWHQSGVAQRWPGAVYYQPDGVIMAVPIESGAAGRPAAGVPIRLFAVDPRAYRSFDAASGGQRFLMNLVDPGELVAPR